MGTSVRLDETTLETLDEQVRGETLRPGDDDYQEARTVWNAKIDKEPAIIVRCTGAADVMAAVNFAREHDLDLAVKGGGHNIAGHAVCEDGLVIDLARMNGVRVDPDAKTVQVQGGATWGDINHETWAFGLDTVGLTYDDIGVGGFTLGGGMANLSRQYGLAVDNLRAVDIVTAEGELVHASEDENPDLFWAVRGGGGNFGVVTSFELDCHEERLEYLNGLFIHPVADAREVLRFYRDFLTEAPDEVVGGAGIVNVPEGSDLPSELHGEAVTMLLTRYMGDIEDGEQILQPVTEFGEPLISILRPEQPQDAEETLLDAGVRNHWKNHYMAEVTDAAVDTFVEQAQPLPTPGASLNFYSIGGAINRVDQDETAYPHRDATHLFEMAIQWTDPDDDEAVISWAREVHEAMAPYATGGEYLNNQTDDDAERVRAAYDENYDRLVEVKNTWDPDNLFCNNQNIEPTV